MCGIAGFSGEGNESDLHRMIAELKHRGPDHQAVCLSEETGMAHARLSIIDINSRSNQPFFNSDKSVVLVYNGEIYNYKELRESLRKEHGLSFHTNSDTEVLLGMYEVHGENFLDQLNGMFAFALYDFRKKQMMLARDRMGKKPLYYGEFNGTLVFGSELKSILKHPLVTRELNLDALNEYLTFEYVPTPNSIFKGIKKLEPAHYLVFQNGDRKSVV